MTRYRIYFKTRDICFLMFMTALVFVVACVPQAKAGCVNAVPDLFTSDMSLSTLLLIAEEERGPPPNKRFEDLPPEQRHKARERLEAIQERREAVRQELENLPPEERALRAQELQEDYESRREARHQQFRRAFSERWEQASPEERKSFCHDAQERCANEQDQNRACAFVTQTCTAE